MAVPEVSQSLLPFPTNTFGPPSVPALCPGSTTTTFPPSTFFSAVVPSPAAPPGSADELFETPVGGGATEAPPALTRADSQ
ncbi:hypothetical protein GCM10027589_26120 [Actinocorallia lasiicapitis]